MNMKKTKMYITKYALTDGILEKEGNISEHGYFGYYTEDRAWHSFMKKDYYETKQQAIARAEEMKQAKINSLKKQLDKFEKMSFS